MHKSFCFILLIILSISSFDSFAQGSKTSSWRITTNSNEVYNPVSLANGMIGIVPAKADLRMQTVFLNGFFDAYGDDQVQAILPAINFADLELEISGENVSTAKKNNWRQTLDMKNACLSTSFNFKNKVNVEQTIYALRHLPYSAMINISLQALEDVEITIANIITVPGELVHPQNFFETISEDKKIELLASCAGSPKGKSVVSASSAFLFAGDKPQLAHQIISANQHKQSYSIKLKKGENHSFSLIGSICSSADFQDPFTACKRLTIFALLEGKEKLIANHRNEWNKLWQSDIIIEGDDQAQLDVRLALYHLYSFVRENTSSSIPPMGLSNFDYHGHIFWDAELWMVPAILVLKPELAKSMLEYRFKNLSSAKRNAASYGFAGAMFPWESDDKGEESTPVWSLSGPLEHHISACVGIAFWNYFLITKDVAWLKEKGYPVLRNVADFWISRVTKNEKGFYEIKNVIGADEYAENVDNDAFTNGAASVALGNAVKAAKILKEKINPLWKAVAENIMIEKFADGTTKEYKGYEGTEIKQADVNLLAYPLNIIRDSSIIKKDLAYYSSRIDKDGPAMSFSILSIISSRLGDTQKAFQYFELAYKPLKRAPFGVLSETRNGNNPYFATAAGGMLQAVLFGFAGLDITDKGIQSIPAKLPKQWKSLIIKGIGIKKDSVTIKNQ